MSLGRSSVTLYCVYRMLVSKVKGGAIKVLMSIAGCGEGESRCFDASKNFGCFGVLGFLQMAKQYLPCEICRENQR